MLGDYYYRLPLAIREQVIGDQSDHHHTFAEARGTVEDAPAESVKRVKRLRLGWAKCEYRGNDGSCSLPLGSAAQILQFSFGFTYSLPFWRVLRRFAAHCHEVARSR